MSATAGSLRAEAPSHLLMSGLRVSRHEAKNLYDNFRVSFCSVADSVVFSASNSVAMICPPSSVAEETAMAASPKRVTADSFQAKCSLTI